MEDKHELSDRLNDFEQTLAQLAPVPARMSVAQAMFLAGQQSARAGQRSQRFWPMIAGALAVSSVVLTILLLIPTQPQIVYVERTVPARADGDEAPDSTTPRDLPSDRTKVNPTPLPQTRLGGMADYLKWRQLAFNDVWAPSPSTSDDEAQEAVRMVRRQDWKALLGQNGLTETPSTSSQSGPFNWRRLLQTPKGS